MRTLYKALLVLLIAIPSSIYAQESSVSGTVTESTGMPIPGVNVVVKNTSKGAVTDFDLQPVRLSGAGRLLNHDALAPAYSGEVRLLEQFLQSGLRAAAPEKERTMRDSRCPPNSEGTQRVDPAERSPWHEWRAEPLFGLLDLCV